MTDVESATKTAEPTAEKVPETVEVAPAADAAAGDGKGNDTTGNGNVDADADGDGDDDNDKTKQERAIIRQVEYYFGDANLNRDKFLLAEISKDEEGWVPLSVLITFKRLAALTTDFEVIIDALVKSDEGLLEISEDKQKLRRHPERPIPEHNEERRKEIQARTLYTKGYPLNAELNEIINFFSAYDKVMNTIMRKYLDKPTKKYKFKGSVFVTFETKEQAQSFLEKEKIMYGERELLRKWQADYQEEKREELKTKTDKKKKIKEQKEEAPIVLPKQAVIHFEGAPNDSTREQVREALENAKTEWEIAYIDFNKGQTEGFVRFQEENAADKFLEMLKDNKVKLKDEITLTLRKATEEEENSVLEKAIDFMKKRRDFTRNKKSGRFGNRKRRFGGHHDGRSDAKKARAE